ncbi:MAG: hypothetical protein ACYCY5_08120, partial [Sulfuricella sp.]
LCPRGFKTAWADKTPAHPTRLMNRGLAAGQLVNDHVILDQNDPAEALADDVDLAFEIQKIRPEIPIVLKEGLVLEHD